MKIKDALIPASIIIIALTIIILGAFNTVNNYKAEVSELKNVHKADSTEIARLKAEAGKTMYMMQQGATGKDTVYFQDKNKVKYQILFIKK